MQTTSRKPALASCFPSAGSVEPCSNRVTCRIPGHKKRAKLLQIPSLEPLLSALKRLCPVMLSPGAGHDHSGTWVVVKCCSPSMEMGSLGLFSSAQTQKSDNLIRHCKSWLCQYQVRKTEKQLNCCGPYFTHVQSGKTSHSLGKKYQVQSKPSAESSYCFKNKQNSIPN